MIRCIHTKCKYPDCDFTCEMDRDDIIKMLQEQIESLLVDRETLRGVLWNLYKDAGRIGEYLSPEREFNSACIQACKFGYVDCIHNPEYLRKYHTKWWVELGMPTECRSDCTEDNFCYDDEDK